MDFEIDGYVDLERIGGGTFGDVYRAWETALNRHVAIKVLKVDQLTDHGEQFRRWFAREGEQLGRLSTHPNIITVHHAGELANGTPYLVMEFAASGVLPVPLAAPDQPGPALEMLRQVTDAIAFGHSHGVQHRDIKPANILVGRHGQYLVADYGIARSREHTRTAHGVAPFTLAHTAPETFVGGYDLRDERSDVYSLVSTLYEALAGSAPLHPLRDNRTTTGLTRYESSLTLPHSSPREATT